jgi:hypothetical protein
MIDLREQLLRVSGSDYRSYGLAVDATVQKRGRPAASFEEARRYFSEKHWIFYLESRVVTNRQALALHVVTGVPGLVHDLVLFRSTIIDRTARTWAVTDMTLMAQGERRSRAGRRLTLTHEASAEIISLEGPARIA